MADDCPPIPDAGLIAILSVPESCPRKISTLSLLYQESSLNTAFALCPSNDDCGEFFPRDFQPINEDLISFMTSSDVSLFDINAGASVATSSSYKRSSCLTTITYSSTSSMLAGGTNERFIVLWRVSFAEPISKTSDNMSLSPLGELYDRPLGRVNGLCFAGDNRLLSASSAGSAHVWDVTKQTLVRRLQLGQWNEQVEGIDVSSDGGTFVAGLGQVLVYCDPRSPREDFHVLLDEYVEDLFWVKSKEHIFVVEASESLLVIDDREPADPVFEWENPIGRCGDSQRKIAELDGKHFVALSDDSVCCVWTYEGQEAWKKRFSDDRLLGLCYCSSGLRREDLRRVEERLLFVCSSGYDHRFRICIGPSGRSILGFSCFAN